MLGSMVLFQCARIPPGKEGTTRTSVNLDHGLHEPLIPSAT